MFRRTTTVAIVALGLLGLTACSASPTVPPTAPTVQNSDQPGDEGQSKEDACALIQQSIEDATGEFESIPTSDPAAVVEAMRSAAAELSDTAAQITNDEVAALVPSLQDMFTQVAEVMDAVVRGDTSKVSELSELSEQFQATSEAFQRVCAP